MRNFSFQTGDGSYGSPSVTVSAARRTLTSSVPRTASLAPLFAAQALPLQGIGRGLVFQLVDALGCIPTADVAEALRALDRQTRRSLGRVGVPNDIAYAATFLASDESEFVTGSILTADGGFTINAGKLT